MTTEQAVKYWRDKGYVELKDGNFVWLYQPNEKGIAYKNEADKWGSYQNMEEWQVVVNPPVLSRLRKLHRLLHKESHVS